MTNSPKIQAIVQEFIGKISQALAEEGSAAIRSALGGEMPAPSAKRRPGRPPGPSSSSAAAAPKAAKRSKGAKRTPEELESQTKALLAQIKKNPGQRIEVIGKAIGISTKDLALPIIKLLENKSITKKGQRRATTYFAK
jgi:hypothetical protein